MASCFPHKTHSSYRGFTLIEVSIVLVIISLMVAVVLTGKTMLEVMRYRRIAGEAQEIKTAMSVFQQRFGAYAGDIKNTSLLSNGATICGPTPGDNNGIVGTAGDPWTEPAQALCQLGNEGLLSPQTSGGTGGWYSPMGAYLPSKAYGVIKPYGSNYQTLGYTIYYTPVFQASFDDTGLPYVIGAIGGPGTLSVTTTGGATPYEAFMLDRKLDDGLPRSGSIRATFARECVVTACATPCMPLAYNVTTYQNTTDNVNKNCIPVFLPTDSN